jgi:hypothetical protein
MNRTDAQVTPLKMTHAPGIQLSLSSVSLLFVVLDRGTNQIIKGRQ